MKKMRKARLTLSIDPEVKKAAQKKAIDQEVTVSEVVEAYLREWTKGKAPCGDE